MYLSQQEANQLECSMFHYFIWRQQASPADDKNDENTLVDTSNNSPLCFNNSHNSYNRIIQVLKEDLPHVAMSETPTLSSSTPEVCFRWLNNATLRINTLGNSSTLRNTKRKRDIADEGVRLAKALKSLPEDAITPEDAKEVISTLRKEHTEAKKITESLELKLSKSEKFHCELLKFHQEKLRLEKRLANLESEDATTEHNFDEQHVKEMEEGEGGQSNVREKLEKQKLRVQLQETMYANAILYEVHDKEQQMEANRLNWESRLQQLIEFKQEFGHCEVGLERNPGLHYWVKRQRRYYRWKKTILSPERIAKLDALGMVWDVDHSRTPRTFEARVEQCRAFREVNGHLGIPLLGERNEDGTEPSEDDNRFRLWAQSMRIQYQKIAAGGKATLDRERIAILDSLGFLWSIDVTNVEGGDISAENQTPDELQFRNRIEQLRKVKEICGNCNEKKNILRVFPNNNPLYTWVKTQRKQMKFWLTGKRTRLTEERREMLRSIEFDHEPRKHYTPTTSTKKKLTKMEKLAIELKERNNNQDSENVSEYDNSDIDEQLQTEAVT